MTVVDLWVNALTGKAAAAFMGQAGNEGIPELLGGDLSASSTLAQLLATMDTCGVDVGVIAAGIAAKETDALLHDVAAHPDRLRVALTVDRPDRPVRQVARLRELAAHPAVALVRITPLVAQYPLNDKLYYPVYATCAELGLPVRSTSGSPARACARPASTPSCSRTSSSTSRGSPSSAHTWATPTRAC